MKRIIMIILFLLIAASIGHDLYLYYQNQDKGFMMSALGFIWTQYSPETYTYVGQNVDENTWAIINSILRQKAVYVTIGLTFIVLLASFMLELLGFGQPREKENTGFSSKRRVNEALGRKSSGRFKYNRK